MLGIGTIFILLLCAQSRAMTLSEAVLSVVKSSPIVKEATRQAELAEGDRYRRFLPNEPQLQYASTDDNSAQAVGITLGVPLPPKTLFMTTVDAAKARGARSEVVARRQELARSVSATFLDCAGARALVAQGENTLSDLETLGRTMRGRYESGSATQAETIGLELQIRQSNADLVANRDKAEVSCRKLGELAHLPPTVVELPDDVSDEVISELGDQTVDESRANAVIEIASANAATSWWSQLPDLTLGVTKNHYSYLPASPAGKENTWSYSAALTVPIFFPFHGSIEAQRSRAQAIMDRGTGELALLAAKSDRRDAAREYARSRARLRELRRKDLPLAEALIESTMSAYRTGRLGFAELVLARKTLTDLRTQEVQLRASVVSAHLRCLRDCEKESSS